MGTSRNVGCFHRLVKCQILFSGKLNDVYIFEIMNIIMKFIYLNNLRNEEINVKKILAVVNATYAVAKRKPEKTRLVGIRTLTSVIPVQRSNQLS